MSTHYNCDGVYCDRSCQEEPPEFLARNPADFASLLEREPPNDGLVHTTHEVQFMNDAGSYSPGTITVGSVRKTALDSAQERIKSLEDVLVAIRAMSSVVVGETHAKIVTLINETLDPCKPWCVQEPGHQGTCAALDADDLEDK